MILGILIGFYGYLFPSNINLMILELYHLKKYSLLVLALILVVLFESIYCFFTLYFLANSLNKEYFFYVKLSAYLLMLVMGFLMFFEKKTAKKVQKNIFYRGLFSTIIHPQQIFFWTFIGLLFPTLLTISKNVGTLSGFVTFNAIGTILALGCYAFWGNKLMMILDVKIYQLNKLLGILYVVIALYYLFSLIN